MNENDNSTYQNRVKQRALTEKFKALSCYDKK